MSWGNRAQIDDLRKEVERLKLILRESMRLRKRAFIAGWNTGLDTSTYGITSEELKRMAADDWAEYLERTDENGD